jgi:hypothetical protein
MSDFRSAVDQSNNFSGFREPAGLKFGEHQFSIGNDIKYSASSPNKGGRDVQGIFYLVSHTGCAGLVVSFTAVCDGYFHFVTSLRSGFCSIPCIHNFLNR